MAEFLIALMPILLAFLGFTQLCFIAIAKLAVRHSAALATRAAVVVLEEADGIPGVPANIYSGFPAGGLEVDKPATNSGSDSGSVDKAQANVSDVSSTAANSDSTKRTMDGLLGSTDRTSSRIKQIRTAAYWPLLAISPNLIDDGVDLASGLSNGQVFPKMTVKTAIGTSDAARILGAFLYNLGAVAVTFPRAAGSKELTDGSFDAGALITTRVSYLFRCQVPLVSPIICSSGWALMFGDAWVDPVTLHNVVKTVGSPPKSAQDLPGWVDEWKQTKAFRDRQQQRVDAFKGREAEFRQVEWPFMLDVLLAWPGARYVVLSAEAQLPLQSANYYPRVSDKDMQNMWGLQAKQQQSGGSLPNVRETFKPLGDAVVATATRVAGGMDQVTGAVDKVRKQGLGYLTQLQSKAGGYIGQLQGEAGGYLGQLQSSYNAYGSELGQVVGGVTGAVGNAIGNPGGLAAGFAGDLQRDAKGYASDLVGDAADYGSDTLSTARGFASDLRNSAAGLGKDAKDAANQYGNFLTSAGKGYATDLTNAGSELAGDVKDTAAGYGADLTGMASSAGLTPASRGKKGSKPPKPARNGVSTGSSQDGSGDGTSPAHAPVPTAPGGGGLDAEDF
jgi:hypothetical protein